MMDAYNIAVCFGPTLLPVPDGYDQVSTQANVNEIIKVFPYFLFSYLALRDSVSKLVAKWIFPIQIISSPSIWRSCFGLFIFSVS